MVVDISRCQMSSHWPNIMGAVGRTASSAEANAFTAQVDLIGKVVYHHWRRLSLTSTDLSGVGRDFWSFVSQEWFVVNRCDLHQLWFQQNKFAGK